MAIEIDDPTYIDPRECGLLMRWAIHHYGSNARAIEAAEQVAIWLLASKEALYDLGETPIHHMPFYKSFFRRERNARHEGDCAVAPSWLQWPSSCGPCVYEEYVAKALECLRIENGGVLDLVP